MMLWYWKMPRRCAMVRVVGSKSGLRYSPYWMICCVDNFDIVVGCVRSTRGGLACTVQRLSIHGHDLATGCTHCFPRRVCIARDTKSTPRTSKFIFFCTRKHCHFAYDSSTYKYALATKVLQRRQRSLGTNNQPRIHKGINTK